jgi:hypothetical protein
MVISHDHVQFELFQVWFWGNISIAEILLLLKLCLKVSLQINCNKGGQEMWNTWGFP